MLTPNDFKKFKEIFSDLIDPLRLSDSKIKEELSLLTSRSSEQKIHNLNVDKSLETLQNDVLDLKDNIKELQKITRKLAKDQKLILDVLDREQVKQRDEIRNVDYNLLKPYFDPAGSMVILPGKIPTHEYQVTFHETSHALRAI